MFGAAVAFRALFPIASLATDGGELEKPTKQAGEDRWVPSLAITGGITIQKQQGFADSNLFEDMSPIPASPPGEASSKGTTPASRPSSAPHWS